MSSPLRIRQPPQYGGFEDTQEELDWYGSNPEGIDRDRSPKAEFSDDDFLPLMQEEDNDDSDGEWSRATYSDASRSSSPPPSSSSLKRKAETSLDASIDRKESRKGTKRRKTRADEVAVSRLRSTIMALPPNIEAIRQTLFDVREEIRWTAEEFAQLWPFVDNFWVCNKPNNPITKSGTQSSYWWCRLHKGATESETHGHRNKNLRTCQPCGIKMKMVKHYSPSDRSILVSIVLSLHEDKAHCLTHNHTLDFMDAVKINSFIMGVAGEQVAQGYEVAWVHRVMKGVKWTANLDALEAAGGKYLNLIRVHNAGAEFKRAHPDDRIRGAKVDWPEQWEACLASLKSQEGVFAQNITAVRQIDGETAHATAFAKKSRIDFLKRRGHLALMDSTHNTNSLKWKLFTIAARSEHGRWIPCAHMVSQFEDGDIVAAFLRTVKKWCGGRGGWLLRYMITDDSSAEQRAVKLAFRGLEAGEQEVQHLLCRRHCEQTLKRELSANNCKKSFEHLYKALYFRFTHAGCLESINAALDAAPEDRRKYIERQWLETRKLWGYYARQHSCLLLQVPGTNPVESWHHSLKIHGEGKGAILKFSLAGIASHVLKIGDQWELRHHETALKWRAYQTAECAQYPALAKFPGPVQELLAGQIRKARDATEGGEIPKGDLTDDLSCQCLFYRQYQLPCSHLWQFHFMSNAFSDSDWERWAYMFQEGGFEIYESTTKEYVIKDIYEEPDGPSKHMLEVREVLDEIKTKFYELEENTASWEDDDRARISASWVTMLRKATGPIRQQGVQLALEDLINAGYDVSKLQAPTNPAKVLVDSENEG